MAQRRNTIKDRTMTNITYDPSGVFLASHGIKQSDLMGLESRLVAARDEVLKDAELWESGGAVPKEKEPLDAGFFGMPDRLRKELHERGTASELGRLKASADRLAGEVDSA